MLRLLTRGLSIDRADLKRVFAIMLPALVEMALSQGTRAAVNLWHFSSGKWMTKEVAWLRGTAHGGVLRRKGSGFHLHAAAA